MSSPEYMVFVGMKILKTLQRLTATTELFFWEVNLSKISQNFDR